MRRIVHTALYLIVALGLACRRQVNADAGKAVALPRPADHGSGVHDGQRRIYAGGEGGGVLRPCQPRAFARHHALTGLLAASHVFDLYWMAR